MRRELWETISDLVGSVMPDDSAAELLRVSSVSLDVPIEVTFRRGEEGVLMLADLPRWRWTTAFDEKRGRLKLLCRQQRAADFEPQIPEDRQLERLT